MGEISGREVVTDTRPSSLPNPHEWIAGPFHSFQDGRSWRHATKTPGASICSLMPSATEILYALGVGDRVAGISEMCDYPVQARQSAAIVARAAALPIPQGPHAPDAIRISQHGEGIFTIDTNWLERERPGLIITQEAWRNAEELGESEESTRRESSSGPESGGVVMNALAKAGLLGQGASSSSTVLMVRPRTMSEVLESVLQIGAAAGVPTAAAALTSNLRARLRAVAAAVGPAPFPRPRVLSLEGLSPLVAGGHWLPEMKQLAGGLDHLQEPGSIAQRLRWEQVLAYAPDVLLLTAVSGSIEESLADVSLLVGRPGWWALPAVRNGEVYVCDYTRFCRPGPRLVEGVEMLARILHPGLVDRKAPPGLVWKLWLPNGQRCRPRQLRNFFQPFS